MAVARKGSLNARQRARLAVQVEQDKIKRQVDLFTEALTAVDARYQTEVRLGTALTELRSMGLSRADIAERTGLTPREVSAAMRAAKEAAVLAAGEEDEATEAEEGTSSDTTTEGSEGVEVSGDSGDDQAVDDDAEHDAMTAHSDNPHPAH